MALKSARKLALNSIEAHLEEVALGESICLFRIMVKESDIYKAKKILNELFAEFLFTELSKPERDYRPFLDLTNDKSLDNTITFANSA
jgi:hypothetical protein